MRHHSPSSKNQGNIIYAPASMIQRQFWLIHQLQPENSAYNIAEVFDIEGSLNVLALHRAINQIIARHEIFRTTFTTRSGELTQKIHPQSEIPLPLIDLETKTNAATEQLLYEKICAPFNLEQGPLIRVFLFQQAEEKFIFLICMHHVITDLHSKTMFAAELLQRYHALTQDSALPPAFSRPPIPYRDYADWQHDWLSSEQARTMGQFWQKEIKEQQGALNLPLDSPRPARLNYNGSHQSFRLDAKTSENLKQFSKANTLDIYVTLLTAFLVLLARYSNQQKIIIGVPLSNRRRQEDKDTMGCFVNILPLSFDLSNSPDFIETARQVRTKMLFAHRHQETPFEQIVELSKPQRDPSYNPIFQVGFTVEPLMELDFLNLKTTPRNIHNQGAQLDLFLNIKNLSGTIEGYFEYNNALFDKETILRFTNHYRNLLAAIIHDASLPVNRLPILGKDEIKQRTEWNNTTADFPEHLSLIDLFEQQAALRPDAIAAVFTGQQITYGQLNEKANQLAHHLHSLEVGPGSLVGIHINRSLEMLTALLGILKSGAAYVPLDPAFPGHRIGQMLEDSHVQCIITHSDLVETLPKNQAHQLCMDTDWPQINSRPANSPNIAIAPDQLAYVIFTSGSTGRPKGVQVPHRAVTNFLLSMQKEPGITAEDSLLAVTTLSFDISVLELFLPLIIGAKLIIADRDTAANGEKLLNLLKSSQASVIQATPTTYHLLLAAGWNQPLPVKVLCGGEPFPADLAQKLIPLATSTWNLYGPTETTIWSTCYRVTTNKPVLIGKPIANTQTYIVNDQQQFCPTGVAGELLIGGMGVTRGYLNQPEMTAQQFIPDIFSGMQDQFIYKTGDLACFLPDGNIKSMGRIDHQVKIRGYRIEPGEIETILTGHQSISQAAVVSHEFGPGDMRLVAWLTLVNQKRPTTRELRQYLAGLLPEYMIPSLFTFLPEMPLTLNNKIDKRALPKPDQTRPELDKKYSAPQNETEQLLAGLWASALQLETAGIDDNFFDLGGNSLLSVQLTAMISKEFEREISIARFFQHPTIRSFAAFLRKAKDSTQSKTSDRARKQRQALARRRQIARR